MEISLYTPDLGYYARETHQVGRGGDFFTSVSVGPLFGQLLAGRFLEEWTALGSPSRWRITECGAHDGTLAADILTTISQENPTAFAALEYAIPEPLAALHAAQHATLTGKFPAAIRLVRSPAELHAEPLPGVIFGNELLDALPFHLVEWTAGGWRECRVGVDEHGDFAIESDHVISDPALLTALVPLGENFSTGYRTEVRTCYSSFLASLTPALTAGLLLWPDYGFARPEYYHPDRSSGTLRTFSKHRAGGNPMLTPGELDITAHVDFTALAEAALALGGQPHRFQNQGSWLTGQARRWLLAQEGNPDPAALRQFQTLTHPAHLGGSFHILEISWNQSHAPSPTDFHRLALRACPAPDSR